MTPSHEESQIELHANYISTYIGDMSEEKTIELVSAKRTANERTGVHSWHPYYAGYSEGFVDSAINYLNLQPTHILLDPWNGSGTTGLVAAKYDLCAVGFDINPVMNRFAQAKSPTLLQHTSLLSILMDELCSSIRDNQVRCGSGDPYLQYTSHSLCCCVRSMYRTIIATAVNEPLLSPMIAGAFRVKPTHSNHIQSFFLSALFKTGRDLGKYSGASNPTWTKAHSEKAKVSERDFLVKYESKVSEMVSHLTATGFRPTNCARQHHTFGDSRDLPLKSNSVDAIITSPPYLTRIDYAMATKPELLILGDELSLRDTREKTMGAPVIVNKNITPSVTWGPTCLGLLRVVSDHYSKASRSYYLPNMIQYFSDAELSLREIVRVLKPHRKALIVIQTSFFKEHEIDLGTIYVEMSQQFPVRAEVVFEETVRGHMAHVNTRSNQYKSRKVYREVVLQLEKLG